jgi:DME family drug/metabolite transporter
MYRGFFADRDAPADSDTTAYRGSPPVNIHLLSVLAASILWGTAGTAQALAPEGAQPMVVGAMRLLIGSVTLGLLLIIRRVRVMRVVRIAPIKQILYAAVGMGAYQAFFFSAVRNTGVAVGTMATMGSAPIFAGVLVCSIFKEFPGRRWAAATLLAVAGCSMLILSGSAGVGVDTLGVLMALIAGCAYAVFAVAARQIVQRMESQVAVTIIAFIAAMALCPVLFSADWQWVFRPKGFGVLIYLGVVTLAASYGLFVFGLKGIPAATATTLSLAEPMTAGLLGIFFLNETLTPTIGIGMALLMSGLAALSTGGPRQRPSEASRMPENRLSRRPDR